MNDDIASEYEITDVTARLSIDNTVRLLQQTYWGVVRPREIVVRSMEHSLCFGVLHGEEQVGFARIVTDYSTFAWLCDVVIDAEHRGQGLARRLMIAVKEHPKLNGVRILLATRDTHALYEPLGYTRFQPDIFLGLGFVPMPPREDS